MLTTIFAYAVHTIHANRTARLEELTAELNAYQEEYESVMLRQGFYLNQVVRLEDEDYIAMLARERYFRSLPNEIVFRVRDADDVPYLSATKDNEEN
jgi:cell division protein DivIC